MSHGIRAQSSLPGTGIRGAIILAGCCMVLALARNRAYAAPTFTVNSPADIVAAAPLNSGPCETATGNGICTLRAAIMKANHFPGGGATINFGLPGAVTYFLTIAAAGADDEATGDLNITAAMSIIGNGTDMTIIDGNGGPAVTTDRVFEISPTVTVTISGVTVQHGHPNFAGGGVANNGILTLDHCAIVDNMADGLNGYGGGIYTSGTLVLSHSVVSRNTTSSNNAYGGGINNQGSLQVLNSTISGNTTSGSIGEGGGFYTVGGAAIVNGSTISGNTAQQGGGIYKTGYPLTVINSTISGNHANINGGGIYAGAAGTAGLFNVTIAENTANADNSGIGVGGGIYNESGSTVNVANSIIALNGYVVVQLPFGLFVNNDCSGILTSQGNNLLYTSDPAHCTVNGAVTYADPNLGPLRNYGGPTQTYPLLAGSPALDAGNAGGCTDNLGAPLTTDQRGGPRPAPAGGRCDIGAFEFGSFGTLDIDVSGTATKYDAPTDGLLAIRYLFGLTGSALAAGALGGTATRTDPAALKTYLDNIRIALDVDGNGAADALTDGLLLIRYLLGLRGPALISGAIGAGATRTAAGDIESYIQSLMP